MNESFVFYKSFFDAMQILDDKSKIDFINSICLLAFEEDNSEVLNQASDVVKALYFIASENIKASIRNRNNGSKGGTKKGLNYLNSENTPLNTPLNSGVNTNVNVNDTDTETVTVNVNDTSENHINIDSPSLNINSIKSWCEKETVNSKSKRNLQKQEVVLNFLQANNLDLSYLDFVLTKTKEKYPVSEIQFGLIANAISWHIDEFKKSTTKPVETKAIKIKPAPKKCSFCNSKLIPGGITNSVICPNCKPKTWWEYSNDEWKCNRD